MKLIILDQDAVINNDSSTIANRSSEWSPILGSLEAIAYLNQMGYRVVVASNRSCDRKMMDITAFNVINDEMCKAVNQVGARIDAIFFSPQSNIEKYNCGKSLITMFEEIALRFYADLKNVFIVGDELRYLRAAEFVGAIPIMVLTGKGKQTKNARSLPKDTKSFTDLASFSDTLIK
jgi:D-glycero-D-manno-heptose 1,7-bisphosphate phosphatase